MLISAPVFSYRKVWKLAKAFETVNLMEYRYRVAHLRSISQLSLALAQCRPLTLVPLASKCIKSIGEYVFRIFVYVAVAEVLLFRGALSGRLAVDHQGRRALDALRGKWHGVCKTCLD